MYKMLVGGKVARSRLETTAGLSRAGASFLRFQTHEELLMFVVRYIAYRADQT